MTIKHKLYQSHPEKIDLSFDATLHRYHRDGRRVPNVSTILDILAKPQLIPWAARMATEHVASCIKPGQSYDEVQLDSILKDAQAAHYKKKVDAGSIGTMVHAWVSDYVTGQNPPLPINEQFLGSVSRFTDWVKSHQVEFLASEQVVYSAKHNYVGTLDAICRIDGRLYIFDLKTNNGLYKLSMGCQMAAYLEARREEFPQEDYSGCVLVRVGKKDGEFEVWQIEDWEPYYQTFLSCLYTYNCVEYLKTHKLA